MNSKEYKAIAEIINNQRAIIEGDGMSRDRLSFLNQRVNILANDLADYFEKEAKERGINNIQEVGDTIPFIDFDRKQRLWGERMNETDYKEIAEIIKKQLHHCADNTKFEINNIVSDLAEYFEKEVKIRFKHISKENMNLTESNS